MKKFEIILTVVSFFVIPSNAFECGQRKRTSPRFWPWHVAIYHRRDTLDRFACGGTLISESFVLTADQQCVSEGNARQFFVRMGVRNLLDLDPNGFQQHGVREIHRTTGLALLELDEQVDFTDYVQPVCLNFEEELAGKFGVFVGWGIDQSDLRALRLTVISEECIGYDSSKFCGRLMEETTACNVTNGAGIHFKRRGVWFLGGIVTSSEGLCSTKDIAAFTKILHFITWIRSVTKIQYSSEKIDTTACTTPTNKPGRCVRIEKCKNIYNIIKSPTAMPKYDYYIKQATCSQPSASRSICCQLAEIDSVEKTQLITIPEPLPQNCGGYLSNRISGGSNANLREFPWMAWLVWRGNKSGNLFVFCQGTLISSRYVLTSAWCVNDDSSTLVQVRLGEYDRSRDPDCNVNDPNDCAPPVRDYDVESFVGHPDLDDETARNDIALIRLRTEVTFEDHIQPVCLPGSESSEDLPNQYIIAGWGATEKNGTWSTVLQKGNVPAVDHSKCVAAFGEKLEYYIGPGVLCAGRNGTNVCTDDNGSLLGYPVRHGGSIRFVQYGITSIFSCGNYYPSIYTDVRFYMDWILDNIEL